MSAMKWMALVLAVWVSPLAHATTVEYVHTDGLGSVVAVSNAAGQVIERREYEPYGHQLTPALADGPGYTGHVQDAATGLTYMQQRYYDPQLGVFISVDPVTSLFNPTDQFHRYRYANNNPYRFVDPDGMLGRDLKAWAREKFSSVLRSAENRAYVHAYGTAEQAKAADTQLVKSVGMAAVAVPAGLVGEGLSNVQVDAVVDVAAGSGFHLNANIVNGENYMGLHTAAVGAYVGLEASVPININLSETYSGVEFFQSFKAGAGFGVGLSVAMDPVGNLTIAPKVGGGLGTIYTAAPGVRINTP